jgi:hypothetical protein
LRDELTVISCFEPLKENCSLSNQAPNISQAQCAIIRRG